MSIALDTSHTFNCKKENVKLIATEFDEPLYGLTLWRFKLYLNDEIFHHELLDYENKFCGLASNLDDYVMSSVNGDYIFIPYGLLVFNCNNFSIDKYITEGGANNDFVSNVFEGDYLIVLYQRNICIIDLIHKTMIQKTYAFEELKFEKMWKSKGKINFLYKDKLTDASKKMVFNLENKEFEK